MMSFKKEMSISTSEKTVTFSFATIQITVGWIDNAKFDSDYST